MARAPSIISLVRAPGRRRRGGLVVRPHMDDGDVVLVEPLPALEVVEHVSGRRARAQQRGVDPVSVEQVQQLAGVAGVERGVALGREAVCV